MWGEVSCLRKQHDGRDLASNHRPSDLKSHALTTTPSHLPTSMYGKTRKLNLSTLLVTWPPNLTNSLCRRASVRNVSFQFVYGGLITLSTQYSVDKSKFRVSLLHRLRATVSLETNTFHPDMVFSIGEYDEV